jgi:thiamine transport system substrate-binding protein
VGILKGTQNRELAEKFVDFMLGKEFQEDLPLQMFVFPVNLEAVLPPDFIKAAQIPADPATMNPEMIGANREKWIKDWTEVVIK